MRDLSKTLFILLAVITASPAWAEAPLLIGVSLSRSGVSFEASRHYEEGLRLWIAEANRQGGVLGRQVELLWRDDQSNPEMAAAAYRELVREADLLLGPVDRLAGMAVLPVLEEAGAPCVFAAPATEGLWVNGRGYAFGVLSPLSEWTEGFFEIVAREGLETVAAVCVDHPHERNVFRSVVRQATRYGLRLVLEEATTRDSVAQALEQARKTGPGALLLWGGSRGTAEALRALRAMRWKPGALFVSSSLFTDHLSALAGTPAEDVFTSLPWVGSAAGAYPGGSEFLRAFRAAHGRDPIYLAASAHAGCQVLAAAALKAGSPDRDKLRQALASLDTVTIVGRYGVDPAGRQLRQFPLTVQRRKGRDEIVWPEQMRTAKPVVGK